MKKAAITILSLAFCGISLSAQTYTTDRVEMRYTDEFLDTVQVTKAANINDYSMIGIQAGAGFGMVSFNPTKNQDFRFNPYNFGITYTRYGKMFGYMSYFGFQGGVFYGQEGYKFKYDEEKHYSPDLEGATEGYFNVIEVPILAHCHVDVWKMKIIANLGCCAGYRLSVCRIGDYVAESIRNSFLDTDRRFDYGIKGGLGLGFVFDPIEIHLQATFKYSLSSLYEPDYASKYYYRYAYPMNLVFSAGIHYQLTKRTGKTSKMLREQIRKEYETE